MENIKNNSINTMTNNMMTNNNDRSSSFSMTEPATTKERQGETNQPGLGLYKPAARNLREYHGVPSMTAGNLEKTMALLQLRPGRLVAQGLASRKLLKSETGMPDTCLDSSSSEAEEVEEEENENTSDVSDSSDSSNSSNTDNSSSVDNDSESKYDLQTEDRKRPIHSALAAAGIKLRPRETSPLLLALGVRPHRLVKLGLVEREALLNSRQGALGRGIGIGRIRHQQHGPPGRRAHGGGGEGVGRPQDAPHPHQRDHAHGRSPAHRRLGRFSSPIHGPHRSHGPAHGLARGPFHRTGRNSHQHQDRMQPFHDVPHGPRHRGRPNHAHGPPPSARMHPHHQLGHFHSGESDGEEGAVVHGGSPGRGPSCGRGAGQHDPPRHHGRPNQAHNQAHGPPPGARMRPHHGPAHRHSGESDGEEGVVVHGGSPGRGRGPFRGRGGEQHGPPRHHGRHNHGLHPQGGGANHGHGHPHQGHHHSGDMHSSGSEEEECVGMRGPRHHGGRRHHGEEKGHRGRHKQAPSDQRR